MSIIQANMQRDIPDRKLALGVEVLKLQHCNTTAYHYL